MARSKGSANLAASLEVLAGAPLDARLLVNEITDLTAEGSYPYFYEGMVVVVKSEEKQYMLIGNDPTDENNWKALGTGGGGGGSDSYSDLSNKPQINSVTLNGNKSSSDLGLQDSMQLETLPAAAAEYEGKIVQFVGTASGDLIPGYFYQCISDGEDPATYSWVAKNVQAGGGSGGTSDYDELTNKPAINGVTLSGDKSTADLGISIPASIDDLTDINLETPTDGQILVYDEANSEWVNANPGASSVAELGDVGDVNLTSISDGQVIKWDANNSEWINANESAPALDGLTDVTLTTPSDGQTLIYDGTNEVWVNGASASPSLEDLTDITVTTPTDGQVLLYDDTNSEWVNADVPGIDEIADIGDVEITDIADGQALVWDDTNSKWINATPAAAGDLGDLDDVEITDIADGQILKWDDTNSQWVNANAGGGGGDAELEADVTSNLAVGAIPSGTTLTQGTTFTEFVQKLLITEIAPTIAFSLSKSGNVAYGGSYTETLTVNVSAMGSAKKIKTIAWYEGSTLITTDTIDSAVAGSWTHTMSTATTDTTTFKAIVTYTKSNDADATDTKTASINFYYNKFYGGVASLTPDEATVEALTSTLATAKGGTYKFTVTAGRICYAYPKSLGALASIKDGNGFSLFDSFTRTEVTYTQNSTSVAYYRYVLTDATTVSGYSVVFA